MPEASSLRTIWAYLGKRSWPLGVFIVVALWRVAETEHKVRRLLAEGNRVGAESERLHAYAPLIGALAGAALTLALFTTVRRIWRGSRAKRL